MTANRRTRACIVFLVKKSVYYLVELKTFQNKVLVENYPGKHLTTILQLIYGHVYRSTKIADIQRCPSDSAKLVAIYIIKIFIVSVILLQELSDYIRARIDLMKTGLNGWGEGRDFLGK